MRKHTSIRLDEQTLQTIELMATKKNTAPATLLRDVINIGLSMATYLDNSGVKLSEEQLRIAQKLNLQYTYEILRILRKNILDNDETAIEENTSATIEHLSVALGLKV